MILDYEKQVLVFFNSANTELSKAIYAEEENLLEVFDQVTKFPAFYYSRNPEPLELAKAVPVYDGENVFKFFSYNMVYEGHILIERQMDALNLMHSIRKYWSENPYIYINWPDDTTQLKIALRLLYIKVEEIRSNRDSKGPLRVLKCSWSSQLFLDQNKEMPTYSGVQISINNKVEVIYNEDE